MSAESSSDPEVQDDVTYQKLMKAMQKVNKQKGDKSGGPVNQKDHLEDEDDDVQNDEEFGEEEIGDMDEEGEEMGEDEVDEEESDEDVIDFNLKEEG